MEYSESTTPQKGVLANSMNEKKSCSNEAYYDDQMRATWIQYGHEADLEENTVCERQVK